MGNNVNDLICENFENENSENLEEIQESEKKDFKNEFGKKFGEFSEFLRDGKMGNCVGIKEKILLKEIKGWYIDPFFYQMASKFDEGGYQGLLINNMEKDGDLKFVLYCGKKNGSVELDGKIRFDNDRDKMKIEGEDRLEEKKTKKYNEKLFNEKTKKKILNHDSIILSEIQKNLTIIKNKKIKKKRNNIIQKLKNFRKSINKVI